MNRCGAILSRAIVILAGLGLFAVPACAQRPTDRQLRGKTAGDSAALILRYARSARFDTAEGAGDRQRLLVGNCTGADSMCHLGPLVRIEPRLWYDGWDRSGPDSGEVIARIISNGPYRSGHGSDTTYKFNLLGADTVYWWVGPPEGRRPVSVFVSSRPGVRPFVSDLTMDPHEPGHWRQPLSRWIWVESDEQAWGTCDGRRCCRSSGLALAAGR